MKAITNRKLDAHCHFIKIDIVCIVDNLGVSASQGLVRRSQGKARAGKIMAQGSQEMF